VSLQIPITGDLTGLQAALRNIPGVVGNAMSQANAAGSRAFGGLFSGLRSSVTGFAGFMRSSLVNAVGAVGIVQSFRSTIQQLDRVGDLSQRFGVSADSLQRLGGVAELSGASMEDVAMAMQKVSRLAAEASIGNDSAAKSFAKIGLSVDQVRGLSPQDLFLEVSDKIAGLASETDQAAAAFEVFGKSGGNVVVMAQMGRDGILEMANGISVAGEESVKAAQAIDDAFDTLGKNFTSIVGEMLVTLNPLLNALLKLANLSTSGIGVIAAGIGGVFSGDFSGFEKALERAAKARESLISDPFGNMAPASVRSVRQAAGGLIPEAPVPEKPKTDPTEAIRGRIDDILSSGRGIDPARIIADSLAQIGGGGNSVLVGRGDEEQKRLLQQQLSALQKIENNTREIDVATLR